MDLEEKLKFKDAIHQLFDFIELHQNADDFIRKTLKELDMTHLDTISVLLAALGSIITHDDVVKDKIISLRESEEISACDATILISALLLTVLNRDVKDFIMGKVK